MNSHKGTRSRHSSGDSPPRRRRSHSISSSSRRRTGDRENPEPGKCLGVFGLSMSTTERDLREVFSKFGRLDTVQVVMDAQTNRSRGFAFVYFEDIEDAKVVSTNDRDLH